MEKIIQRMFEHPFPDRISGLRMTGNLFLTGHRKITCTGSLEGSRIGVSLAVY